MATYDSVHTGEQVDNAVDIVLGNKSKGSATQPIYLDANGAAQNVNVDATPTDSSANLVQSGGVYTQLGTKYAKADISTDANLGTSNTVIPSQGAVKSYVDAGLATKQDVVVAGDGIVKDGNTLSISTDNDFMTVGKLDNKWSHFVSGLDMGYGTETIEKMETAKRSTFDRSKFTVVGSPVITDDGIASGFSSSNYIKTQSTVTFSDNIIIQGSFTTPSVLSNSDNILAGQINQYIGLEINNSKFTVSIGNGSEWVISGSSGSTTLNTSTKYYYKIVFDGSKYLVHLSTDNTNWTLDNTITTTQIIPACVLFFGTGRAALGGFTGSIDLKQFSITVDGVEVFNGNKTGIDTIKPVDFTAVENGTSVPNPTLPVNNGLIITEDGVASGFSSSNYLYSSANLSNINNWEIEFECICGDTTGTIIPLAYTRYNNSGSNEMLRLQQNGTHCYCVVNGSINDNQFTLMENGGKYKFNLSFEGTTLTIKQYKDGVLLSSKNIVTTAFAYNGYFMFGNDLNANAHWSGSLNLNAFKLYVDGNLVYQSCLKIPYTQTKDGKKIVDYDYRDRVEDEYGQAGFTPYYTLDTESRGNYTVVGSPTISADGVVDTTSFTSNDYITSSLPISRMANGNSWDLYIPIRFKTLPPVSTNLGLLKRPSGDFPLQLGFNGNQIRIFLSSNNSSWNIVNINVAYTWALNIDYIIHFGFTGSKYFVNINNAEVWSLTTATKIYNTGDLNYTFGYWGSYQGVFYLDLKEFKVYVDNKLTYQAVIPSNYTMATVKESAIVDSYDNGINKWTKLANLTCKQQGSCTSGTAVTFTKPYIDTNYALSVPYTSGTKTKTGFTPSATGDWIANGKVDLNA